MSENEWPSLPEEYRAFEGATREESNRQLVFDFLQVPDDVRSLLRMYDAVLMPKSLGMSLGLTGFTAPLGEKRETDYSRWHLHLPTRNGNPVIMPLPVTIEDEGHWKAIIAAAADLQGMVNRGEYRPG